MRRCWKSGSGLKDEEDETKGLFRICEMVV